jgi:2-haloacid dehalogenase
VLVAAHEDDLAAARSSGLRTAFVRRPKEFGRRSGYDLPRDRSFDYVADDFVHLASQLRFEVFQVLSSAGKQQR